MQVINRGDGFAFQRDDHVTLFQLCRGGGTVFFNRDDQDAGGLRQLVKAHEATMQVDVLSATPR